MCELVICVCGNSLILYILYILRAVIFLMTRLRSNLGFDNVCVFVLCVYIMIIVIYLPTIWNKRERRVLLISFFSFVRSSYQISEISPTLSLYTIYIKALVEAIYMVIILYKRNSSFFNFLSFLRFRCFTVVCVLY